MTRRKLPEGGGWIDQHSSPLGPRAHVAAVKRRVADRSGVYSVAIHDYRAFAHPLAQIKAVHEFLAFMSGCANGGWELSFTDDAPDEGDVPTPIQVLTALEAAGLRFERSSTDEDRLAFWDIRTHDDEPLDVLLFSWAYEAMDALALEPRLFWSGLHNSNIIFVPDHEEIVPRALTLLHIAERERVSVWQRLENDSSRFERLRKTKKPGRAESGPAEHADFSVVMRPEGGKS